MSTTSEVVAIGVGFDTAHYGHHVSFLRADRQPAAPAFHFTESADGYQSVREALQRLQQRHGRVHFHLRLDAAGQYAVNLERFLRALPFAMTLSVGQPKCNANYRKAHFPKRKADAVESLACARFAIVERPPATKPAAPACAELREVAGVLHSRGKHTTRLTNKLHNTLARVFPELATSAGNLAADWVLALLAKYPTPQKIAAARLKSLTAIPYLSEATATRVQDQARRSVAGFRGPVAEELVRQQVAVLRQAKRDRNQMKALLQKAYDALPASNHVFIETIVGIGKQTAAALVAKMVDIDRFETPNSVVAYFGVFPEENTSGTDKYGKPIPPGAMRMSRQGNDLVRACLWNAAKTAIIHNPVIKALYARKRRQGKRGDVALGHCMRKLLHLVFAVWKSGQPFVAPETTDTPDVAVGADNEVTTDTCTEEAAGRKEQSSERQAVTTAPAIVSQPPPPSNQAPQVPALDFAALRSHLTIEQVLREAQWWDCLHDDGTQRRGPCPLHSDGRLRSRSFSVNLHKNVFQCFHPPCSAKGNLLDLWAQLRRTSIYQAAHELAERFNLFDLCTEQRRGTRKSEPVSNGGRS